MSLVVPDVGEALMLGRILNKTAQDDLRIYLYTNDFVPVEGTVISDLDEGTITHKVLTGASWSISGSPTEASYAEQEFVIGAGAGVSVYGFFITDATGVAGTGLVWAERFTDGPYVVPAGGGSVFVTPKIQLA